MDPLYLQGLREAKGLLDEGVFSPEVMRLLFCCSQARSGDMCGVLTMW
jgi:hypothetical protein